MTRFGFFEDIDRSIQAAQVAPGALSRCETTNSTAATAPESRFAGKSYVLTLDGGQEIHVTDAVIIGRQPSTEADAVPAGAEAVMMSDPKGLISRNHLLVKRHGEGLVAIDLGSTNGTILGRDERSAPLPPHKPVNIQAGDELIVGTRRVRIAILS